MKKDIKEFLEQFALCAVAIGVVFHLNSKLAPKSEPKQPTPNRMEQVDSVKTDTLKNIPKVLAISKNQNTR